MRICLTVVSVLLLLVPCTVAQESLADAAKRVRQKKDGQPAQAETKPATSPKPRVYTTDDMHVSGDSGSSGGSGPLGYTLQADTLGDGKFLRFDILPLHSSAEDCAVACNKDANCVQFVFGPKWMEEGMSCRLFSTVGRSQKMAGRVTGLRPVPTAANSTNEMVTIKLLENMAFRADAYQSFAVGREKNARSCALACQHDPNCRAFVLGAVASSTGTEYNCNLYATATRPLETAGCIAGIK